MIQLSRPHMYSFIIKKINEPGNENIVPGFKKIRDILERGGKLDQEQIDFVMKIKYEDVERTRILFRRGKLR
jgi:hypothetical protein